jgi:TM2 domain-containing membrane protein YozV
MEDFQEFDIENSKLIKTGNLKKHLSGFIDAISVIILTNFFFLMVPKAGQIIAFKNMYGFLFFYFFLLFILYRFLTIFIFKRTIGMIILNMQFAKNDDPTFSTKEKLCAVFMLYLNDLDCYDNKQKR